MIIKKFVGKSELEATEIARRELGNGIVIMNVKKVKPKGLFRFLKPQLTEVTVALEEEQERSYGAREETGVSPRVKEAVDAISQVVARTQREAEQAETPSIAPTPAIRETIAPTPAPRESVPVQAPAEPVRAPSRSGEGAAIEKRLDNLQNLLERQLGPREDTEEEKKAPAKQEPQMSKEDAEMLKFMKLLYQTMLENEVNEIYANQIMEDMEKSSKPGMPIDYVLAATYQKMILKFGQPSPIAPSSSGPKIVFFVGPTGVGKTTTIAKIASHFSVDQKKKVALLTADTYRIAAAEQLRTYANILEVPFRVIYTVEEVENALHDFQAYDYILVDTAGHSHQNEVQREQMNAFIHSVDGMVEKEVFLVLSATTKYRDLISIADTYSSMTDYKLIFTKLDETTTLGNLLNLRLHTGTTISYVTNGQNVPDDISAFNPQKTVKLLLGGKK